MSNTVIIREKTTSDLQFTLKSDGTAIDLSGVDHIRFDMIDKNRKVYRYNSSDASPAIVITTPASGIITFTPPDSSVFQYLSSPYRLYIWVFETSTKAYAVPEDSEMIIKLTKEF